MRPLWLGTLGGLAASPVALGVATLLRYVWPGFPLLRVLDFFADMIAAPVSVLTGQPVVLDPFGNVDDGMLTLLIAYGVVMTAWCTVGGLVAGAVVEQTRQAGAPGQRR